MSALLAAEEALGGATALITPSINSPWVLMAKHVATLFPAGSLLPIEIRCFRNRRIGSRGFFQDGRISFAVSGHHASIVIASERSSHPSAR